MKTKTAVMNLKPDLRKPIVLQQNQLIMILMLKAGFNFWCENTITFICAQKINIRFFKSVRFYINLVSENQTAIGTYFVLFSDIL